MKKNLFLMGIVLLIFTACIRPPDQPYYDYDRPDPDRLEAEEKFELDFRFLHDELGKHYVNLPYKEERFNIDWDERKEKYGEQIAQVEDERDFFRITSRLVSELKDGHTSLMTANRAVSSRLFGDLRRVKEAFDIRIIEGKGIIVRAPKEYEITGSEVLSINGIDFSELMDTTIRHYYLGSTDKAAASRAALYDLYLNYFALYEDQVPGEYQLELKDAEGSVKMVIFDTKERYLNFDELEVYTGDEDGAPPSGEVLEPDNIGYLLITTFGFPRDGMKGRFREAVRLFRERDVRGVIIDVRYNPGGNESFRDLLEYLTAETVPINTFRYFKSERFRDLYRLRPLYEIYRRGFPEDSKDDDYTGWWSWEIEPTEETFLREVPVVVLSNEATFSSADAFVNACLNYGLATVVGNGVPLSGHGLPTPVMLPGGNYYIQYGFQEIRDPDGAVIENAVKEPDIYVEPAISDLRLGIDTQLEEAIRYINAETN